LAPPQRRTRRRPREPEHDVSACCGSITCCRSRRGDWQGSGGLRPLLARTARRPYKPGGQGSLSRTEH
jgi:hypothetical protein